MQVGIAPGDLPPEPSRLERLAERAELDPDHLREYLRAEVERHRGTATEEEAAVWSEALEEIGPEALAVALAALG